MSPLLTDPAIVVPVLGVIFLASVVRSTFGFGDALFAMPPITLLLGPKVAVPLVALTTLVPSILIPLLDRAAIDWASARRLCLASLPGIPVGLLLLHGVEERTLGWIVGTVTLAYAVWALTRRVRHTAISEEWVWLFGFLSGVMGAATTTAGPPAVVYASLRRWPPLEARATLQAYFFFICLVVVVGHALTGGWSDPGVLLVVPSLPVIALAVWVGSKIHRRLDPARFYRALHVLLAILGAALLWRA